MKLKLGVEHAASTIRRYMVDSGPVPSSTWRAFLANQAPDIYAFDLTTQVMWDYSLCYVLVVLELRTRCVVHVNVTRSRPWDGPKFLLHDNDGIFGQFRSSKPFRSALDAWLSQVMGIRERPLRASDRDSEARVPEPPHLPLRISSSANSDRLRQLLQPGQAPPGHLGDSG